MDEETNQQKHAISTSSFVLMFFAALLCDGISALLGMITIDGGILNSAFAFFVNMGVWLWTAQHGMGFKGAMAGGAGMVVEIIPWVNMLPTFAAIITGLFIASRAKEKIPLPEAAKKLAKKI